MARTHHYLKTLPKYFKEIESGKKTFEVRKNDRDYKEYDILHLQEHTPCTLTEDGALLCHQHYTGREIIKEVGYLLDDPEYCKEGYVIMGLKDL